jgi:hypothetical protein
MASWPFSPVKVHTDTDDREKQPNDDDDDVNWSNILFHCPFQLFNPTSFNTQSNYYIAFCVLQSICIIGRLMLIGRVLAKFSIQREVKDANKEGILNSDMTFYHDGHHHNRFMPISCL